MNDPDELSFTPENIFKLLLASAFGFWAWVVKVAAHRHLESLDRIEKSIKVLSRRVTRLETKMKIYHHEEYDGESEEDAE